MYSTRLHQEANLGIPVNSRSLLLDSAIRRGTLKVGTQVNIMMHDSGVGLVGRVAAMRDGLLLVPLFCRRIPASVTQLGTQLEVRWEGEDYSEYRLNTTVISYVDGKSVLVLKASERVTRVQRRAFFRVDTELGVEYSIVRCEHLETSGLGDIWFDGMIMNLSGGGCKLRTAVVLPISCILSIRLTLGNDTDPYIVEGRVLRSEPGSDHFCYGIAFVGLEQYVQDDIVEYVMRTEAKRVKSSVAY